MFTPPTMCLTQNGQKCDLLGFSPVPLIYLIFFGIEIQTFHELGRDERGSEGIFFTLWLQGFYFPTVQKL